MTDLDQIEARVNAACEQAKEAGFLPGKILVDDVPWLLARVRELEDAAARLATALRHAPATSYSEPYYRWFKSWCEPALEEYDASAAGGEQTP